MEAAWLVVLADKGYQGGDSGLFFRRYGILAYVLYYNKC